MYVVAHRLFHNIYFYLQAEVERRDKEIEKLNTLLSETKRKNQKVQDKMIEQIEIIKNKLEEYKLDHKTHESSIEDDIGAKYLFFSLLLFPQNERKYTKVGFRGNNSSIL